MYHINDIKEITQKYLNRNSRMCGQTPSHDSLHLSASTPQLFEHPLITKSQCNIKVSYVQRLRWTVNPGLGTLLCGVQWPSVPFHRTVHHIGGAVLQVASNVLAKNRVRTTIGMIETGNLKLEYIQIMSVWRDIPRK